MIRQTIDTISGRDHMQKLVFLLTPAHHQILPVLKVHLEDLGERLGDLGELHFTVV
jgi:hypothetical protein